MGKHGCKIIGEQHPHAERKNVLHGRFLCGTVYGDQGSRQDPNRHLREYLPQIRKVDIKQSRCGTQDQPAANMGIGVKSLFVFIRLLTCSIVYQMEKDYEFFFS